MDQRPALSCGAHAREAIWEVSEEEPHGAAETCGSATTKIEVAQKTDRLG